MIHFSEERDIKIEQILPIYELNGWSSAQKPELLHQALLNSHHLVSAWNGEQLVGIGNAISDGFLVVYYPHLLVHPDYQGKGIGRKLLHHQYWCVIELSRLSFLLSYSRAQLRTLQNFMFYL